MKCSGKQQLYPPDVERLNKQIKEQKLIDVVNKAESLGLSNASHSGGYIFATYMLRFMALNICNQCAT